MRRIAGAGPSARATRVSENEIEKAMQNSTSDVCAGAPASPPTPPWPAISAVDPTCITDAATGASSSRERAFIMSGGSIHAYIAADDDDAAKEDAPADAAVVEWARKRATVECPEAAVRKITAPALDEGVAAMCLVYDVYAALGDIGEGVCAAVVRAHEDPGHLSSVRAHIVARMECAGVLAREAAARVSAFYERFQASRRWLQDCIDALRTHGPELGAAAHRNDLFAAATSGLATVMRRRDGLRDIGVLWMLHQATSAGQWAHAMRAAEQAAAAAAAAGGVVADWRRGRMRLDAELSSMEAAVIHASDTYDHSAAGIVRWLLDIVRTLSPSRGGGWPTAVPARLSAEAAGASEDAGSAHAALRHLARALPPPESSAARHVDEILHAPRPLRPIDTTPVDEIARAAECVWGLAQHIDGGAQEPMQLMNGGACVIALGLSNCVAAYNFTLRALTPWGREHLPHLAAPRMDAPKTCAAVRAAAASVRRWCGDSASARALADNADAVAANLETVHVHDPRTASAICLLAAGQ